MAAIFFLLFFSAPAFAADSEECKVALVDSLEGNSAKLESKEGTQELKDGDAVEVGESVVTGADAVVDLVLCDESTIRVGNNSIYKLVSVSSGNWLWHLIRGYIRAKVTPDPEAKSSKFRVYTPSAAMGVRGTEFVVEETDEGTSVHTFEGEVLMGGSEFAKELSRPFAEIKTPFQAVRPEFFSRISRGAPGAELPKKFLRGEFEKKRPQLFRRAFERRTREGLNFQGRAQRALGERRQRLQRRMDPKEQLKRVTPKQGPRQLQKQLPTPRIPNLPIQRKSLPRGPGFRR